jgi:hypothetical protein
VQMSLLLYLHDATRQVFVIPVVKDSSLVIYLFPLFLAPFSCSVAKRHSFYMQ